MGVGTPRDSVPWGLLGVELRRENKPHGDGASMTEAAADGLEPVATKAREGWKQGLLLSWNPHPILPIWNSPDTLWEPFPS